ncbi:DUF4376 domain-containing protein [Undibacterium sp. Di26W]|uniref:DUF4376 domain-containing protein n=1 Tax=Undibacterium sp. Di26W TaxID=3413035 RepID=UPI003BF3242B
MKYAKLNEDGTFDNEIGPGNIEWDATHFCSASNLTELEAATFRVVPLFETDPPKINEYQLVERDGAEKVGGQWRYKWKIVDITDPATIAQIDVKKAAAIRESKKAQRQAIVDAITVVVGEKVFDGDEVSQGRMARALIALQFANLSSTKWTLANNETVSVTVPELSQALILSGQRQTDIWALS